MLEVGDLVKLFDSRYEHVEGVADWNSWSTLKILSTFNYAIINWVDECADKPSNIIGVYVPADPTRKSALVMEVEKVC